MFALRSSLGPLRRAGIAPVSRAFSVSSFARAGHGPKEIAIKDFKSSMTLEEATGPETLFGPGGKPNEIPSDLDIATGLDRLELLGKLEGIDIFDEKPLVQTKKGTVEDPVVVDSWDRIRYIGCTGWPPGSSEVNWLKLEEGKISRDWESGCVYTLNYIGPKDDEHHH